MRNSHFVFCFAVIVVYASFAEAQGVFVNSCNSAVNEVPGDVFLPHDNIGVNSDLCLINNVESETFVWVQVKVFDNSMRSLGRSTTVIHMEPCQSLNVTYNRGLEVHQTADGSFEIPPSAFAIFTGGATNYPSLDFPESIGSLAFTTVSELFYFQNGDLIARTDGIQRTSRLVFSRVLGFLGRLNAVIADSRTARKQPYFASTMTRKGM
jgi:hypothetical protein